jgi:uncharacterized surface anchored protein
VLDASGAPAQNVMLTLQPAEASFGGFSGVGRAAVRNDKGTFELAGVAPGSYTLVATLASREQRSSTRVPLQVRNDNVNDLVVTLINPINLSGTVRVEGVDKPDLSATPVQISFESLSSAMSRTPSPAAKPDGTFLAEGVSPDKYRISASSLPDGMYLKSVRAAGQEAPNFMVDLSTGVAIPLEIVLSPNAGQVLGVVQDASRTPIPGVTVVLMNELSRRIESASSYKQLTTDQNGQFSVKGLAPGEYVAFSWESIESGAYMDPDFMRKYEALGTKISIKEGATANITLRLIPSENSAAQNPAIVIK